MLNSLEVVNGSMSPQFVSDIFEYNVTVNDEVVSLVLDYKAPEGATVTIYGNDYLTEGENHVIIEVYEDELKTYTLTVMKESSSEAASTYNSYEKVEVNTNAWYKELITPGISVICFMTIVFLFCIIFRKK